MSVARESEVKNSNNNNDSSSSSSSSNNGGDITRGWEMVVSAQQKAMLFYVQFSQSRQVQR